MFLGRAAQVLGSCFGLSVPVTVGHGTTGGCARQTMHKVGRDLAPGYPLSSLFMVPYLCHLPLAATGDVFLSSSEQLVSATHPCGSGSEWMMEHSCKCFMLGGVWLGAEGGEWPLHPGLLLPSSWGQRVIISVGIPQLPGLCSVCHPAPLLDAALCQEVAVRGHSHLARVSLPFGLPVLPVQPLAGCLSLPAPGRQNFPHSQALCPPCAGKEAGQDWEQPSRAGAQQLCSPLQE